MNDLPYPGYGNIRDNKFVAFLGRRVRICTKLEGRAVSLSLKDLTEDSTRNEMWGSEELRVGHRKPWSLDHWHDRDRPIRFAA